MTAEGARRPMDRPRQQQSQDQAVWPSHLRAEQRTTGIGRGAQAGLAITGSLLAGLLVLSWNGPFPAAPSQQQGPAPVAVDR
ncbi:hypothetical protein KLP28_11405 [Nocardioidaceae bacterium]|nr:hypothetical protein KLP28_11405 [Nocardioidaceae bacterium]